VVEAMACGTPLLVDDNPMLRELDNKKMAVVFCKDRSSESLAEAMHVELKKDNKISKITPRHIELSWRHSNTVNQLEKLIADAIQGAY
jgi:glycosyltransferase involved in cell wall biosynthesis